MFDPQRSQNQAHDIFFVCRNNFDTTSSLPASSGLKNLRWMSPKQLLSEQGCSLVTQQVALRFQSEMCEPPANSLVEYRPRRKKKKQPVRTTMSFCALLLTAVVSSNAIEAKPPEELLRWQHSLFDGMVQDTEIDDEIIDPRTPAPLHWSESVSGGCSVHNVLNNRDAALPHRDISLAPQSSSALMENYHRNGTFIDPALTVTMAVSSCGLVQHAQYYDVFGVPAHSEVSTNDSRDGDSVAYEDYDLQLRSHAAALSSPTIPGTSTEPFETLLRSKGSPLDRYFENKAKLAAAVYEHSCDTSFATGDNVSNCHEGNHPTFHSPHHVLATAARELGNDAPPHALITQR